MKTLIHSYNWWLLWGILAPLLLIFECLSWIYINPFSMILFESFPSALFGLWIISQEKFNDNIKKFFILSLILCALIFLFGYNATWLAPIILIVCMKIFNFTKEEFLWSFGNILLYGILGLIPLGIFVFILPSSETLDTQSIPLIISELFSIAVLGYFLKGAVYGFILHMLYLKRVQ